MPRTHGDGRSSGANAVLSDSARRDIERQKSGPWCCVCGFSIAQSMVDLGYDTHPTCGPLDRPAPRSTD